MTVLHLDAGQLEQLAELVAERVAAARLVPAPLVGVREVAAYLGVEDSYVYEHAAELGARRLGSGPKARLRFSLEDVDALTSCLTSRESSGQQAASLSHSRPRRRPAIGTTARLLPVRGTRPPDSGRSEAA